MYVLSLWLLLRMKLDPSCSFTDGFALSSHAKDLQRQNRSLSHCDSVRADVTFGKVDASASWVFSLPCGERCQ